MADTLPLILDDLIAFGRDYLAALKERPVGDIHLHRPLLEQFLTEAAEALALQRDLASKQRGASGRRVGRPPGGMGDQMVRLVDNGVPELEALRITKRAWGKNSDAVLRAYEEARKKTPR